MSQTSDSKSSAVAQDQDTVIGDAMVDASIIVYDMAVALARKIAENAQYAIDLAEIRKAELCLAYMQGVDFGLAMDSKPMLAYLAHMEKCVCSVKRSRASGFQLQIYTPPPPWDYLDFDEKHARSVGPLFLRALSDVPPSEEDIRKLEDEMWRSRGKDPGRIVEDPSSPGTFVMAELGEATEDMPENGADEDDDESIVDAVTGDSAIPKKPPRVIKRKKDSRERKMENDGADFKAKVAEIVNGIREDNGGLGFGNLNITTTESGAVITFNTDGDTPEKRYENGIMIRDELERRGLSVKRNVWMLGHHLQIVTVEKPKADALDGISELKTLKNLYRTHRIDKTALKGGLSTLLAAGLISKAEFHGAMNS